MVAVFPVARIRVGARMSSSSGSSSRSGCNNNSSRSRNCTMCRCGRYSTFNINNRTGNYSNTMTNTQDTRSPNHPSSNDNDHGS